MEQEPKQDQEANSVHDEPPSPTQLRARLAIYESVGCAPQVIDVSAEEIAEFMSIAAETTYLASQEKGGQIPYAPIKEVIENLIHADFKDVVISVLPGGNTIIVSDRGPGIADKQRALLPGYTTASSFARQFIRGVGSGLPTAKEVMGMLGGEIKIDDNLGSGTVVTLLIKNTKEPLPRNASLGRHESEQGETLLSLRPLPLDQAPLPQLSERQLKVLSLLTDLESAGPSAIARELGFSVATAYREISYLQKLGYVRTTSSGQRCITKRGLRYLEVTLRRQGTSDD